MVPMTHPKPDLPQRAGSRPRTTLINPHTQPDQNAPAELHLKTV